MAEEIKTTEELLGQDFQKDTLTTEELFGGNVPKPNQRTVYLEDKGITVGYPDTFTTEQVASFVRGDIYQEPILPKAPEQLPDIARIAAIPKEVEEFDKELFTPFEQAKYGFERVISSVIEKPVFAVAELAFRGLRGTSKFADHIGINYEIDRGLKEKYNGWLDKAVDYYAQPEKYGFVTPAAAKKQAQYREAQYQKNFALGIGADISEATTDLFSLFLQMGMIKGVTAAKETALAVSRLPDIYRSMALMGTHGFMTSKGEIDERAKSALYRIGYSITPYIANATGAIGLTAVAIDTSLNTFLTSPTYVEAFSEAGGVNKEFLAMAIPQFVMDVGMAWNTRGLPENIRRARIEKYLQTRPENMQFKDQKIAPEEKITPEIKPEEGILPLAIRLKSGEIITDPAAKLHSDIITSKGINPDDVQDVGIMQKKAPAEGKVNPLVAEAQKYNSAEEFIKSKGGSLAVGDKLFANSRAQENYLRKIWNEAKLSTPAEEMEYIPTKLPDEKGGAPLEAGEEVPKEALEKAKGLVEVSEGEKLIVKIQEEITKPQPDEKIIREELAKEPLGKETKPLFIKGLPEDQKLLEFQSLIKGEGFITYPTTPELRKFIKNLPENVNQRKAIKLFEQTFKTLSKETPPSQTKPTIERTTGVRNLVDTIMMKEDVALRMRLRTEARAAKKGYIAGKEEIRELNQIKGEVEDLASRLFNLSKRDLPPEYKDIIESELDALGMLEGKRPLKARQKLLSFIGEQREKGQFIPLSESEIALADYVNLGNATKDLLQKKYDILKQVAEIGTREKELIAFGEKLDFEKTLAIVIDSIKRNIGERVKIVTKGLTPSGRQQGFVKKITNSIDAYFAHHRKVEFISRTLDGFKEGDVQKQLIVKINRANDKELLDNEKDLKQFKDLFNKIDRGKFLSETVEVNYNDKVKVLTKEEILGIYLNNLNDGNRYRLTNPEGWNLTQEQINDAISKLTPQEKALGDAMQKIADGKWEEAAGIRYALTGKEMGKVVDYWPIYADKEISKYAQLKEGEKDLFQDVMNKTFVEKGFTEKREGGVAPVDLRAIRVFLNHITRVNHFNSHALAVRDTQKIISEPRFKETVIKALGENIYKQYQPWLKDIANPKQYAQDMSERWIDRMRNNATSAVLGIKATVSLLQLGSYTQTIKELGLWNATKGLVDFYHNPIELGKKIYELSPQMKFRSKTFDRDLREFIESKAGQELVKGKSKGQEILFAAIKTLDKAATLPTWWSAFQSKMDKTNGDVKASVEFAEGVVRRTQPAGAIKDLSAVMKGSKWKKIWTMFYTHYSNYHNQMAMEFDKLKMGKDNPIKRIGDFTVAHIWLTVAPALFAEWVRGGFRKPEEEEELKWAGKAILGYATGSMPIIRDIASRIIRGRPDPITSPAFAGLEMAGRLGIELTKPLKEDEIRGEKVFEYGMRTTGYLTGLPTEQAWVTMSGIMDLVNEETDDIRRLIFSPYQLEEK